jgi:hypothetical protein
VNDMADGLNMAPRVGEPESALEPGMAAPAPRKAQDGRLGVEALDMPDTSFPGSVAAPSPAHWVYDYDPATGVSRATYNGEVSFTSGGSSTAGVTSWNTRTGAVALQLADITGAGGAPIASPAFTGTPSAPTRLAGDSSAAIATTAFVGAAIAAGPEVTFFNGRTGNVTLTTGDVTGAGGAPVNSPSFTGTPSAPTPAQGDADSSIATTMFVSNALASGAVTSFNGRLGAVNLTLSDVQSVGGAAVSSPNFTGAPTGPTPTVGDATTKLATTAFVTSAVSAATAGVASFNTRTGAVTLTSADVIAAGGAPIVSPTFTGTPAAPTVTAGDSTTKLATTAFVATAIGGLPPGVATFNGRQGTVVQLLTDITSVGGAPVASPAFTGSPLSTTPAPGDNSTRVATTAFVAASFATTASVTASLGSYLPLAGGTLTGATVSPAGNAINGAAGTARSLFGTTAGSKRWEMRLGDATAEGSNAGSLFQLIPYTDAGAALGPAALSIDRAASRSTITCSAGAALTVQSTSGSAVINVNAPSSGKAMQVAGQMNGANRWALNLGDGTAEGGSSSGSDYLLQAISDGGAFTQPMRIVRSTQVCSFSQPIVNGSDRRIKTSVEAIADALAIVQQLQGVFYHSTEGDTAKRHVGLIAQDVQPVLPEVVHETGAPHDAEGKAIEGEPPLLGVSYGNVVAVLIEAVKELAARVAVLEGAT